MNASQICTPFEVINVSLKLAKEYKTKPTKEVYDNIQIIDKQLEDFYVNRNKLLT